MAHRYRGNGSKTGTKEILQVVLIRQFGLCSPAIYIITHPIAVLHFRKTKSIINGQAGRERYFMNSGLAPFFSGYQYYPISSLATIQSCSRSTFQNRYTLHILRIQIRNAVASVTIAGIGCTSNSRIGLFGSRVEHRNTIYYI